MPAEPTPFSFSRILPKLYLGSQPSLGPWLGENFHTLVLCAREIQPEASHFPRLPSLVRLQLHDDGQPPRPGEFRQALEAAALVAERVASDRRCLVTCHMGINRSALVTALAIQRLLGLSGGEATTWVRLHRPGTLTNRHFAAFLQAQPPPRALLTNGQPTQAQQLLRARFA